MNEIIYELNKGCMFPENGKWDLRTLKVRDNHLVPRKGCGCYSLNDEMVVCESCRLIFDRCDNISKSDDDSAARLLILEDNLKELTKLYQSLYRKMDAILSSINRTHAND